MGMNRIFATILAAVSLTLLAVGAVALSASTANTRAIAAVTTPTVYACAETPSGELACAIDTDGLRATETGYVRDLCTGDIVKASYSTVNATRDEVATLCA